MLNTKFLIYFTFSVYIYFLIIFYLHYFERLLELFEYYLYFSHNLHYYCLYYTLIFKIIAKYYLF